MKKKLIQFTTIFLIVSIFFSLNTISHAENEISNETGFNEEIENTESITQFSTNENIFKISDTNLNINNTITGDVFILCNKTVTLDTYIEGNVFICANDVIITENAQINSSLFVLAKNVELNGEIGGNAYVGAEKIKTGLYSNIVLDLYAMCENLDLAGNISRNANVGSANITFENTAQISGNLTYSSEKEIEIPENVVNGETTFVASNNNSENQPKEKSSKFSIISIIKYIICAVIIYLLFKYSAMKKVVEEIDFKNNLGKYILFGILGLIIAPIIGFLLLILILTAKLSLLVFVLYFTLIIISTTIALVTLSAYFSNVLKDKLQINDDVRTILLIILFSIIYCILKMIPVLGALSTLLIGMTGFGIILYNLFTTSNQISKE